MSDWPEGRWTTWRDLTKGPETHREFTTYAKLYADGEIHWNPAERICYEQIADRFGIPLPELQLPWPDADVQRDDGYLGHWSVFKALAEANVEFFEDQVVRD